MTTPTKKPYRVWITEKLYYTMDILAESEEAARDFANEHAELWNEVDGDSHSDVTEIAECNDADFVPVNDDDGPPPDVQAEIDYANTAPPSLQDR